MSVKHIEFLKIKQSKILVVEVRPVRCLLDTPSGTIRTAKWMNYSHWKELRCLLNGVADEYEEQKENLKITQQIEFGKPRCKVGSTIQIGYMFKPMPYFSSYFLTPREDATWTDDEEDTSTQLRDKGGRYASHMACGEMLVVSVTLCELPAPSTSQSQESSQEARDRESLAASSRVLHKRKYKQALTTKKLIKALDVSLDYSSTISDYFKPNPKSSTESTDNSTGPQPSNETNPNTVPLGNMISEFQQRDSKCKERNSFQACKSTLYAETRAIESSRTNPHSEVAPYGNSQKAPGGLAHKGLQPSSDIAQSYVRPDLAQDADNTGFTELPGHSQSAEPQKVDVDNFNGRTLTLNSSELNYSLDHNYADSSKSSFGGNCDKPFKVENFDYIDTMDIKKEQAHSDLVSKCSDSISVLGSSIPSNELSESCAVAENSVDQNVFEHNPSSITDIPSYPGFESARATDTQQLLRNVDLCNLKATEHAMFHSVDMHACNTVTDEAVSYLQLGDSQGMDSLVDNRQEMRYREYDDTQDYNPYDCSQRTEEEYSLQQMQMGMEGFGYNLSKHAGYDPPNMATNSRMKENSLLASGGTNYVIIEESNPTEPETASTSFTFMEEKYIPQRSSLTLRWPEEKTPSAFSQEECISHHVGKEKSVLGESLCMGGVEHVPQRVTPVIEALEESSSLASLHSEQNNFDGPFPPDNNMKDYSESEFALECNKIQSVSNMYPSEHFLPQGGNLAETKSAVCGSYQRANSKHISLQTLKSIEYLKSYTTLKRQSDVKVDDVAMSVTKSKACSSRHENTEDTKKRKKKFQDKGFSMNQSKISKWLKLKDKVPSAGREKFDAPSDLSSTMSGCSDGKEESNTCKSITFAKDEERHIDSVSENRRSAGFLGLGNSIAESQANELCVSVESGMSGVEHELSTITDAPSSPVFGPPKRIKPSSNAYVYDLHAREQPIGEREQGHASHLSNDIQVCGSSASYALSHHGISGSQIKRQLKKIEIDHQNVGNVPKELAQHEYHNRYEEGYIPQQTDSRIREQDDLFEHHGCDQYNIAAQCRVKEEQLPLVSSGATCGVKKDLESRVPEAENLTLSCVKEHNPQKMISRVRLTNKNMSPVYNERVHGEQKTVMEESVLEEDLYLKHTMCISQGETPMVESPKESSSSTNLQSKRSNSSCPVASSQNMEGYSNNGSDMKSNTIQSDDTIVLKKKSKSCSQRHESDVHLKKFQPASSPTSQFKILKWIKPKYHDKKKWREKSDGITSCSSTLSRLSDVGEESEADGDTSFAQRERRQTNSDLKNSPSHKDLRFSSDTPNTEVSESYVAAENNRYQTNESNTTIDAQPTLVSGPAGRARAQHLSSGERESNNSTYLSSEMQGDGGSTNHHFGGLHGSNVLTERQQIHCSRSDSPGFTQPSCSHRTDEECIPQQTECRKEGNLDEKLPQLDKNGPQTVVGRTRIQECMSLTPRSSNRKSVQKESESRDLELGHLPYFPNANEYVPTKIVPKTELPLRDVTLACHEEYIPQKLVPRTKLTKENMTLACSEEYVPQRVGHRTTLKEKNMPLVYDEEYVPQRLVSYTRLASVDAPLHCSEEEYFPQRLGPKRRMTYENTSTSCSKEECVTQPSDKKKGSPKKGSCVAARDEHVPQRSVPMIEAPEGLSQANTESQRRDSRPSNEDMEEPVDNEFNLRRSLRIRKKPEASKSEDLTECSTSEDEHVCTEKDSVGKEHLSKTTLESMQFLESYTKICDSGSFLASKTKPQECLQRDKSLLKIQSPTVKLKKYKMSEEQRREKPKPKSSVCKKKSEKGCLQRDESPLKIKSPTVKLEKCKVSEEQRREKPRPKSLVCKKKSAKATVKSVNGRKKSEITTLKGSILDKQTEKATLKGSILDKHNEKTTLKGSKCKKKSEKTTLKASRSRNKSPKKTQKDSAGERRSGKNTPKGSCKKNEIASGEKKQQKLQFASKNTDSSKKLTFTSPMQPGGKSQESGAKAKTKSSPKNQKLGDHAEKSKGRCFKSGENSHFSDLLNSSNDSGNGRSKGRTKKRSPSKNQNKKDEFFNSSSSKGTEESFSEIEWSLLGEDSNKETRLDAINCEHEDMFDMEKLSPMSGAELRGQESPRSASPHSLEVSRDGEVEILTSASNDEQRLAKDDSTKLVDEQYDSRLLTALRSSYNKLQQMTKEDLENRLEESLPYLDLVAKGKIPNYRHQLYKTNGRRLNQLGDELIFGPFTDEQICFVLGLLKVKLHRIDEAIQDYTYSKIYRCKVLAPTFFTKIVMDNENVSLEQAERLLVRFSLDKKIAENT